MRREKFLSPIDTLERPQIEKIQLTKLKEQLARCCEFSDFYHKKFAAVGFSPGALQRLDQLQLLPFTYKHELRQTQSEKPPWGGLMVSDRESWREVHPTTGTTGMPVYKIWSQKDVHNITDYVTRMLFGIGIRPGDILHNAYQYGLRMGAISVQRVAEKIGCFVLPMGDAQIKTQIEYLVNLHPTVLFAMPSIAFALAEHIKERGIDPAGLSLRIGCFSGEPGVPVSAIRGRLEKDFALTAYDVYGLTEIGPLMAAECEIRDGLHWAEDHHLVEVIDPETLKPCTPGKEGIVVITELTADAMPLIRYWTNDVARLDFKKCSCGRTHAKAVGGILGRADDLIMYRGVKFYPALIESVLCKFDELGNEFRVVLHRNTCGSIEICTIKVECVYVNGDIELLRDRIREALTQELKVLVDVELIPFGTLDRPIIKPNRIIDMQKKQGN